MQTINVGNKRLIAVTVPDGATDIRLRKPYNDPYFHLNYLEHTMGGFKSYGNKRWVYSDFGGKLKYPSDMKIVGFAKSITEDQWAGIVEWEFDTFRDYEMVEQIGSHVFDTATESGLSLLQKHGVDPENTLIIEII